MLYKRDVTRRMLTDAEKALARSVFGAAIDLDRVGINRAPWWPFQPKDAVMAPDGDLWCHPQGALYRGCFAKDKPSMQALFIHEMTHVWQTQRGGRWYLPLMRHPFCRYDYVLTPGKPFARYGIEQQAEIVADAFLLRSGAPRRKLHPLAFYEALLPFQPA